MALRWVNGKLVVTEDEGGVWRPKDWETNSLIHQRNRMYNRVENAGGDPAKQGKGWFDRTMDVLSRPNYMVANAAKSLFDDDNSGNIFSEGWQGLAGKDKTTFSNVLDEAGMPGGWQRSVLGLGLDIGLDPTTYLTLGTKAAAGAALRGAKAASAASTVHDIAKGARSTKELDKLNDILKTYKLATQTKTTKQVGRAAALAENAERLKRGEKLLTGKQLISIARKAEADHAMDLAKAAEKAAGEAVEVTGRTISARFAGKEILNKDISRLTNSKVTKKLLDSPYVQALNRNFRTAGTFGNELNDARKLQYSRATAAYDEMLNRPFAEYGGKSWLDIEKTMTPKEAVDFFDAYEMGLLETLPSHTKAGQSYEEITGMVKKLNDEMYDSEFDEGLLAFKRDTNGNFEIDPDTGQYVPENPKLENYLYHHVVKGQKKKKAYKKRYRSAVATDAHNPGVHRVQQYAKNAGPDVVIERDVRLAMRNRMAKHTQAMGRANFLKEAVDNFGIKVGSQSTKKFLEKEGHDLIPLRSKLADPERGAALEWLDDDIFVPREIGEKLGGIQTIVNEPGPFIEFMDKLIKWWKPLATVYNPGHHIRNLQSDVFLNYMDGVTNLNVYRKAAKIRLIPGGATKGQTKVGNSFLRVR